MDKHTFQVFGAAMLGALAICSAAAATPPSSRSLVTLPRPLASPLERQGWSLFGGAAMGYGNVRGRDYNGAPDGVSYFMRALLSYRAPTWVFDAGIGWFFSQMDGHNFRDQPIALRTRGALISMSPRLRIGSHWQIGPAFDVAFGTDTAFGPSINGQLATYLVGARAAYEFAVDRFPIRIVPQAMTDVSISGRQVYLAMVGLEIGFPLTAPSNDEPNRAEEVSRLSSVAKSAKRERIVRVSLDDQKVFFGTNSSRLKPGVSETLARLGQYLALNRDNWGGVDIAGHADRRGSYSYNLRLSRQRASSVAAALGLGDEASVDGRLDVKAFSYLKPLDRASGPTAWARNRRVDLVFYDVRDARPLIDIVKPLMRLKPELNEDRR